VATPGGDLGRGEATGRVSAPLLRRQPHAPCLDCGVTWRRYRANVAEVACDGRSIASRTRGGEATTLYVGMC
jgi:hypothetical protein